MEEGAGGGNGNGAPLRPPTHLPALTVETSLPANDHDRLVPGPALNDGRNTTSHTYMLPELSSHSGSSSPAPSAVPVPSQNSGRSKSHGPSLTPSANSASASHPSAVDQPAQGSLTAPATPTGPASPASLNNSAFAAASGPTLSFGFGGIGGGSEANGRPGVMELMERGRLGPQLLAAGQVQRKDRRAQTIDGHAGPPHTLQLERPGRLKSPSPIPAPIDDIPTALRDISVKVDAHFQSLTEHILAMRKSLDISNWREHPKASASGYSNGTAQGTFTRSAARTQTAASNATTGPLIGRPKEMPDRSQSRHPTGQSMHSTFHVDDRQEHIQNYRRPSETGMIPAALRRPSMDWSNHIVPRIGSDVPVATTSSSSVFAPRLSDVGMRTNSNEPVPETHSVKESRRNGTEQGVHFWQSGSSLLQRGFSSETASASEVSIRRPSNSGRDWGQRRPSEGSEELPRDRNRPAGEEDIHGIWHPRVLSNLSNSHEVPGDIKEEKDSDSEDSVQSTKHVESRRTFSDGDRGFSLPGFGKEARWSLNPKLATKSFDHSDHTSNSKDRAAGTVKSRVARKSLNLQLALPTIENSPKWILMPGSPLRIGWDIVVIFATAVAATLMPLSLVYLENATGAFNERTVNDVLNVSDLLWVIDVILNFRTALEVNGQLITDTREIALIYARSWLMVDIITAWPVLLAPAGTGWILLILKLARLLRAILLLEGLQKEIRWLPVLPTKVLLVTVLPAHLLACLWRMSIKADVEDVDTTSAWWDFYIHDAYWVSMTITTVGYGDVPPQGRVGRIMAIFGMTLAPFFNGCIVSLLTHVTKGLFENEIERQVVEASRFMRNREVADELQRRVEHNFRVRLHQEQHVTMAPNLLNKLSPSMQRELTLELLSSTVLNFPLFTGAPVAFIAEIAQAHAWVQCNAGDLVVEEGQLEQEVVFVVMGRLVMFVKAEEARRSKMRKIGFARSKTGCRNTQTKEDLQEIEILSGAWFGEACLFNDGCVRRATVFSENESELAVLNCMEYHRIVRKYPMLKERHFALQEEVDAGHRNLDDLVYTAPSTRERAKTGEFFQRAKQWVTHFRQSEKKKKKAATVPTIPNSPSAIRRSVSGTNSDKHERSERLSQSRQLSFTSVSSAK